ncbi:MAG: glycosyltransferase, partial [Verrucomicrobiota bacterium]|nr:glycosyltransferase [Verrucomicrobiota bacterium]
GSDDSTGQIISEIAKKDDRVRYIRNEHHGIVCALNTGLDVAKGKYIARMDADDFSYPPRLALQKEHLDSHSEIAMVSCLVDFGGNKEKNKGYFLYVDWINSILSSEEIRFNRFVESPFAHPSVMFRKSLIKKYGGYAEGNFPEDYELWLRWLDLGVKMEKIPEKLLLWNDTSTRLSRTENRYSFDNFYRCKAKYLAEWLKKHNPHYPDIMLCGSGRTTRKRADMLCKYGINILSYIDVDPKRIGQKIHTIPVIAYLDIPSPEKSFIVSYVANRGAHKQISNKLEQKGFKKGKNYIFGA